MYYIYGRVRAIPAYHRVYRLYDSYDNKMDSSYRTTILLSYCHTQSLIDFSNVFQLFNFGWYTKRFKEFWISIYLIYYHLHPVVICVNTL